MSTCSRLCKGRCGGATAHATHLLQPDFVAAHSEERELEGGRIFGGQACNRGSTSGGGRKALVKLRCKRANPGCISPLAYGRWAGTRAFCFCL